MAKAARRCLLSLISAVPFIIDTTAAAAANSPSLPSSRRCSKEEEEEEDEEPSATEADAKEPDRRPVQNAEQADARHWIRSDFPSLFPPPAKVCSLRWT